MLMLNDHLMLCLAKQIMQERLSEVETYRLLKMGKQKRQQWYIHAIRLLLSGVGLLMLNLGMRLQRYSFTLGEREVR